MESNFIQGGCVVNWKIDNCNFYRRYVSPTFYLENSQETEWNLIMIHQNGSFTCYLEPVNIQLKTVVCFDVCISSNEESVKRCGIKFYPTEYNINLAYLGLEENMPFGSLLLQARLKNIADLSFAEHHFSFRSIEEVESRTVIYDVMLYPILFENRNLRLRVLSLSQNSIPLKLRLWSSKRGDVTFLNIQINEYIKKNIFGLFCKINLEDLQGKLIISETKCHRFGEKVDLYDEYERENLKCCLKIPLYEEDMTVLSSSNYKIKLKCDFYTTYGKCTSWIEKSSQIPVLEENIGQTRAKNFENEKHILENDFIRFYKEGKYTDVVLRAHGSQFQAHKVILRARSPVIAALLDADVEGKENNVLEIDVDPETLDQMIYFMYSDTLKTEEYGNIVKLYEAADKYKVLNVKDKCSMVLKKSLNVQNASELLILAYLHQDTEFQNAVEEFILSRGKKVLQTEEWNSLMKNEPRLGCNLLMKFCTSVI